MAVAAFGKTAKAGTVSVGKLTTLPTIAPITNSDSATFGIGLN